MPPMAKVPRPLEMATLLSGLSAHETQRSYQPEGFSAGVGERRKTEV